MHVEQGLNLIAAHLRVGRLYMVPGDRPTPSLMSEFKLALAYVRSVTKSVEHFNATTKQ